MKRYAKYILTALCALLAFALLAFAACAPAGETSPSSSAGTSSSLGEIGGTDSPDSSVGTNSSDDTGGTKEEPLDDTDGGENPGEDSALPGGLINGGNFSGNHT